MTRERIFGSDQEFCEWMRGCKDELPSWSKDCGWVATDVDLVIHRYLTSVDGMGTRDVQCIMDIEIKTRGATVNKSQQDTLYKKHRCSSHKTRGVKIDGQIVRYWGVSFCRMSGKNPDDSDLIEWGRFQKRGRIKWRKISRKILIELMRFDRHPDNLSYRPLRRHHKTTEYVVSMKSPLGFEYEKPITKES